MLNLFTPQLKLCFDSLQKELEGLANLEFGWNIRSLKQDREVSDLEGGMGKDALDDLGTYDYALVGDQGALGQLGEVFGDTKKWPILLI